MSKPKPGSKDSPQRAGAIARNAKLTPEQRSDIARRASVARWIKHFAALDAQKKT